VVRRRIAQELNDSVGAAMDALGEHLDALARALPQDLDPEAHRRVQESRSLLVETVDSLRKAVADLRGPLLENHALPATLRWYAETVGRRTGMNVVVETYGSDFRVADEKAVCLLRIVQDVVTNLAKHAKTPKARMVLKRKAGRVRLSIVVDDLYVSAGNGAAETLAGMNQAVEAVDGRLKVDSSPSNGTCITVEVAARR
jgi:signal transduction histidine kinase